MRSWAITRSTETSNSVVASLVIRSVRRPPIPFLLPSLAVELLLKQIDRPLRNTHARGTDEYDREGTRKERRRPEPEQLDSLGQLASGLLCRAEDQLGECQ